MGNTEVTLKDIYDAQERLEAKIDKRLSVVEEKVNKLESFLNKTLGVLAVFGLFAGFISSYIWQKVIGDQ